MERGKKEDIMGEREKGIKGKEREEIKIGLEFGRGRGILIVFSIIRH